MQALSPALPELTTLVCGRNYAASGDLGNSIVHIRNSLYRIQQELPPPYGTNPLISQVYAPFLVRNILEMFFTALLSRL